MTLRIALHKELYGDFSFSVLRHGIVDLICISVNAIYFIPCTLWKKIYLGETGRRFLPPYSIPPQHDNLQANLTPRERRKPQKSQTKIHLPTGYTLSTRDQWTPLMPLICLQIHDIIFPPMAKLLHTPTKTYNTPQFLYSLWRNASARKVSFLNLSQW